jgi:hypothetical protein
LLQSARVANSDLTAIPVFDSGRPVFVILAQGLDERQVKERFTEIKAFLSKVAKALRAVALRAEIRQG